MSAGTLIKPALQDDAFLASVKAGAEAGDGALRLWWLGQSGFLIQYQGEHLLLDPYLSDSLTKKYAGTEKARPLSRTPRLFTYHIMNSRLSAIATRA